MGGGRGSPLAMASLTCFMFSIADLSESDCKNKEGERGSDGEFGR